MGRKRPNIPGLIAVVLCILGRLSVEGKGRASFIIFFGVYWLDLIAVSLGSLLGSRWVSLGVSLGCFWGLFGVSLGVSLGSRRRIEGFYEASLLGFLEANLGFPWGALGLLEYLWGSSRGSLGVFLGDYLRSINGIFKRTAGRTTIV